jgi:hypothetical protein
MRAPRAYKSVPFPGMDFCTGIRGTLSAERKRVDDETATFLGIMNKNLLNFEG